MRYRIKITTYKTGRVEYHPAVKKWWVWKSMWDDGEETSCDSSFRTREAALRAIDNHYAGNHKIIKIEFEYITK